MNTHESKLVCFFYLYFNVSVFFLPRNAPSSYCVLFLTISPLRFRSCLFQLWIRTCSLLKMGCQSKEKPNNNRLANSVDLDEIARYEPSHLDRSTLLAKVSVLICKVKMVARLKWLTQDKKYGIGTLTLLSISFRKPFSLLGALHSRSKLENFVIIECKPILS